MSETEPHMRGLFRAECFTDAGAQLLLLHVSGAVRVRVQPGAF